jgi:uncharacterized protein (DUF885 family)
MNALVLLFAAALPMFQAHPKAAAAPAAGDKAAKLKALYEQFWEETLQLNPLQATFQGDSRYDDQLPNFLSAADRDKNLEFEKRWLKTVQDVGSAGLKGQDLLSHEIFVHDAESAIERGCCPSTRWAASRACSCSSVPAPARSRSRP